MWLSLTNEWRLFYLGDTLHQKEGLTMLKKLTIVATVCLLSIGFLFGTGLAAGPSLEKWKPAFDPSVSYQA